MAAPAVSGVKRRVEEQATREDDDKRARESTTTGHEDDADADADADAEVKPEANAGLPASEALPRPLLADFALAAREDDDDDDAEVDADAEPEDDAGLPATRVLQLERRRGVFGLTAHEDTVLVLVGRRKLTIDMASCVRDESRKFGFPLSSDDCLFWDSDKPFVLGGSDDDSIVLFGLEDDTQVKLPPQHDGLGPVASHPDGGVVACRGHGYLVRITHGGDIYSIDGTGWDMVGDFRAGVGRMTMTDIAGGRKIDDPSPGKDPEFKDIHCLAVARDGTVYVGDGHAIRVLRPATGEVLTLAGVFDGVEDEGPTRVDGPGPVARFDGSRRLRLAVDDDNRVLYVLDDIYGLHGFGSASIRAVDCDTGNVTTLGVFHAWKELGRGFAFSQRCNALFVSDAEGVYAIHLPPVPGRAWERRGWIVTAWLAQQAATMFGDELPF